MDGNQLTARFITVTRWEDLPSEVQEKARMCLVDNEIGPRQMLEDRLSDPVVRNHKGTKSTKKAVLNTDFTDYTDSISAIARLLLRVIWASPEISADARYYAFKIRAIREIRV